MDEACIATANTVIPEPIDGELLGEISRELSNLSNMIKADVADDDNIISSDPLVKFDEITETSISSTDSASDSDRSASPDNCVLTAPCDDNNWGPATFIERHGLDNVNSAHTVRHVAPDYDMVSLLQEVVGSAEDQDPAFVVDLSVVMRKLSDWKRLMPRIHPFYAIKCNGDDAICRMLADSGCGFDCASKAEIEAALAYGAPPHLIIYANPCKQASMLRYARSVGVTKMTADNVEELHKIQADLHPRGGGGAPHRGRRLQVGLPLQLQVRRAGLAEWRRAARDVPHARARGRRLLVPRRLGLRRRPALRRRRRLRAAGVRPRGRATASRPRSSTAAAAFRGTRPPASLSPTSRPSSGPRSSATSRRPVACASSRSPAATWSLRRTRTRSQ